MDFEELKKRSGADGLEKYAKVVRFDVGTHKQTKLKRTLGSRSKSTLLAGTVSATHQKRLLKQFLGRWGKLQRVEEQERLRFFTVLGSLAEVNEKNILKHIGILKRELIQVFKKVKGLDVIGCFEIEIVNFKVMTARATQAGVDEARKLFVLEAMLGDIDRTLLEQKAPSDSYALIHFHGIIDFGNNAEVKVEQLRIAAKEIWRGSHRVEMTRFHTNKTTGANLRFLAKYLVKGGNENLIYKIGFGWDSDENVEREMLKQGKYKQDPNDEGVENELSLSIEEVKVLGSAIDSLMGITKSRNMRTGYLFKYGQRYRRG